MVGYHLVSHVIPISNWILPHTACSYIHIPLQRAIQLEGKMIDLAELIHLGVATDEDFNHYEKINAEIDTIREQIS
jgi:hypothetical protein